MIKFIIKIKNKVFNAFRGIYYLLKEENSFLFYIFWLIAVLILGFVFKVTMLDWIILIIVYAFVIALEIVNTAIENLADHISLQYSVKLKKIKDISAAATLIMLFFAFVVNLLVFIPNIISYFS